MTNRAIVAVPGSGKTVTLVDEAIANDKKRVLLTTFTLENVAQLRECLESRHGYVPKHVSIQSWYSFLLAECTRPYQRAVLGDSPRIDGLYFETVPWAARRFTKTQAGYYITKDATVYRDRLADLAVSVNRVTRGAVVARLRQMYDVIMIDELQDMAGSDLDLIEAFMDSGFEIVMVCDPRQATFRTNNATRNRKYRGAAIVDWLEQLEKKDRLTIEERNESYRCNTEICTFANKLFPELPATVSRNPTRTGHDGIFFVALADVPSYYDRWRPMILRYNRDRYVHNLPAKNFGEVKGRTYERVLIFPTEAMLKHLENGTVEGDVSKFYVAVTRARASVAFVRDEPKKKLSRKAAKVS